MKNIHLFRVGKMALESMASLSDLLSSFLSSSTPPSPSPSPSLSPLSLKPISKSSLCTLPSSISVAAAKPSQHKTKIFFTAEEDDDVINRVAYPSLANANLVFFKSGFYNVEVVPEDDDSEELLVNDFKRSVFRAGVMQECRRRRFFENNQEKRKRKTKEAAKKYRKRRPIPKPEPHSTPEIPKTRNVYREEEDNWELPPEDVEVPYINRS